jgi:hypothetical protein
MNEQPIISVEEFRKLAGIASESFSDDEITELIMQLDFMAQLYIKSQKQGEKHS